MKNRKRKVNAKEGPEPKNKDNYEYAGPTEKLPTGLKHIREDTAKEEQIKSKTEKT